MDSLFQLLKRYISVADPVLNEQLIQALQPVTFQKKEQIHYPGKLSRELYFIESGIARSYYSMPDGKEVTCYFAFAGEFFAPIDSFFTGKPGVVGVEAVSPIMGYSLSKDSLLDLYSKFPAMERAGRLLVEEQFIWLLNRTYSFPFTNAEERFRLLLEQYPSIFLDVPQGHIASFLAITPETLSRLRAKCR